MYQFYPSLGSDLTQVRIVKVKVGGWFEKMNKHMDTKVYKCVYHNFGTVSHWIWVSRGSHVDQNPVFRVASLLGL